MLIRRLKPLICFIMLLAVLGTLPVSANAAYENTYKNTGNMRNDIIGVALTQVGYREGSNNYTKYGVWFGQPNAPWCGIFISWCADQAGIPSSIIRRNGIANPKNFGLSYKNGNSYRPQKGDLFFTKSFSHAGLVYYTDGDYFYTLEGNTNTQGSNGVGVFIRKRKISEHYFSSPNYKNSGGKHNYKTGYNTAHPHKEYKYCNHCGDKYYTGKTKASDSCKTCLQASCSHKYGKWTKTSSSKHAKICTLCGKKVTESHNWKNGNVIKEPNCKKTGKQEQVCSVCNTTKTITLPATDKHTYDTAKYLDATYHQAVCSVCGKKKKTEHTTDGWSIDQTNHWKACTVCEEVLTIVEHDFPDGCTSACTSCEYVRPGTHKVGDIFVFDETDHWKICEKCGNATDVAEHTYQTECDEYCESCGYIRESDKEHTFVVLKDITGHWSECTVCGFVTEVKPHLPDQLARSWETQKCTECEYILRSSEEHIHEYSLSQHDSQYHWGSCECGEPMLKTVHQWNVSTGTCTDCGAQYEPELSDDSQFLVYVGIAVAGVVGIPLIIVLLVKIFRKKRY